MNRALRMPDQGNRTAPGAERMVRDLAGPGEHLEGSIRPILILSTPLTPSSWIGAMLGQHPQLYCLPETHLFVGENVREWRKVCSRSVFPMRHGLLRAIAELIFAGQTEANVRLAAGWLERRSFYTTGCLLEVLANQVPGRTLIEKSATTALHANSLRRAIAMFPQARFLHLVQHPLRHHAAVIAALKETAATPGRTPEWLPYLAFASNPAPHDFSQERPELNPQRSWLEWNRAVETHLAEIPNQKMRLRIEEILDAPDDALASVARWLGLRCDDEARVAMRHPERSPFGGFGPPGARYGDDVRFLRNPSIPCPRSEEHPLRGLGDRFADTEISSDVRGLAEQYGYE